MPSPHFRRSHPTFGPSCAPDLRKSGVRGLPEDHAVAAFTSAPRSSPSPSHTTLADATPSGPAQQLTGAPADLGRHGLDPQALEEEMDRGVASSPAQHLRECRRGDDDRSAGRDRPPDKGADGVLAPRGLAETVAVQYEPDRAVAGPHSSPCQLRRALSSASAETGPCVASMRSSHSRRARRRWFSATVSAMYRDTLRGPTRSSMSSRSSAGSLTETFR